MVGGDEEVSRFRDPLANDDYDVQMRLKEGDRNDSQTIARLYVPSERGGLVQLDNLVTLSPALSASNFCFPSPGGSFKRRATSLLQIACATGERLVFSPQTKR